MFRQHVPSTYSASSLDQAPPLARNYCVTFELALALKSGCEFKGHAIIARARGGAWERGYSARDERVIERVSSTERLLEEEWSGEVRVISIRS